MRLARTLLLLGVLAAAGGCAVGYRSDDAPERAVPDRSASVLVGETTRDAVRLAFGAPLHASARFGFDLFRATTVQSEVVAAATPLPIPFARIEDEIHRYTLVAYGAEDRVAAVASGLHRKPADWRNVSPISFDHMALHLRAGEVLFFVDPEGAREANLLALPVARDRYLAARRGATSCTVVLGCVGSGCPDRIAVDGGAERRLPLRLAHAYWLSAAAKAAWMEGLEPHSTAAREPWLEPLVALSLAPGLRTLRFSAAHLDGAERTRIDCRAGEVSQLEISVTAVEAFWRARLADWRFTAGGALTERFARRPLVLMDDGQWWVEP